MYISYLREKTENQFLFQEIDAQSPDQKRPKLDAGSDITNKDLITSLNMARPTLICYALPSDRQGISNELPAISNVSAFIK